MRCRDRWRWGSWCCEGHRLNQLADQRCNRLDLRPAIGEIAKNVKGVLDDLRVNAFKIDRVKGEDDVFAEFAADATVISTGASTIRTTYLVCALNAVKLSCQGIFDTPQVVPAFSRDSAAEGGNIGRFPPQDRCRLTLACAR
jgi:hypothetical protein